MNDRQEALNLVSGFLAGFYHQTWDYEAATKNARTHIEQYPHVKEEMTSAFENVLSNAFPPNTFLTLVRHASGANRYVEDDADARTFLQELYNDVIFESQNGSEQPNEEDGSSLNSLHDKDEAKDTLPSAGSASAASEEDDPFETSTVDGELDIPQLLADLWNGEPETRSLAVVALAKSGDYSVVEPLIATLKNHSNSEVRWGAIQVLWRLGDMRAVEPLMVALVNDEDSYVRFATAYALGQLRDQRAIQALIAAFYDETKVVGFSASLALAELGAATVEPLLALLYQDDEKSNEVEHALRAMEDHDAIYPLLATLKHQDSRMRAYAALFLMHFDDQRVRLREPLTEALEDPDSWVRHNARLSLDMLGADAPDVAY